MFRFLLLSAFLIAGCSSKNEDGGFPRFEYDPELEATEWVMKYENFKVSYKEFNEKYTEYRAFEEEMLAFRTAVALEALNKEGHLDKEVQVSGASREATLMAIQRMRLSVKPLNFVFKNPQGRNTIVSKGKTYDVFLMPLNNMELARLQSMDYFKGQLVAEEILIQNMLSASEKKILSEDVKATTEELKKYLSENKVDPKAIGLKGVQKIKDLIVEKKLKSIYKTYVDRNVYKKPIQSRWKKPEFKFETLPEKPIYIGEGKFKIIVISPYDCRNCIEWHKKVEQFLTHGVEIKYYPVITDDNRNNTQHFYSSILCLSEQRGDALWRLQSRLKGSLSQPEIDQNVRQFLKENKLDDITYYKCRDYKKYDRHLQHYQKFAQTLPIKNYPLVIAGGFVFSGSINPEDVKRALEVENAHFTYKWKNWFKKKL